MLPLRGNYSQLESRTNVWLSTDDGANFILAIHSIF